VLQPLNFIYKDIDRGDFPAPHQGNLHRLTMELLPVYLIVHTIYKDLMRSLLSWLIA